MFRKKFPVNCISALSFYPWNITDELPGPLLHSADPAFHSDSWQVTDPVQWIHHCFLSAQASRRIIQPVYPHILLASGRPALFRALYGFLLPIRRTRKILQWKRCPHLRKILKYWRIWGIGVIKMGLELQNSGPARAVVFAPCLAWWNERKACFSGVGYGRQEIPDWKRSRSCLQLRDNIGVSGLGIPGPAHRFKAVNSLLCRKPFFLYYKAPLLRHQSPVGGRGALWWDGFD
jgi:hypothetical protein